MPGLDNRGVDEILLEMGVITISDFKKALEYKRKTNKRIEDILVGLKLVSRDDILKATATKFGVKFIDLDKYSNIDKALLSKISKNLVIRYNVLPLKISNNAMFVAMHDPSDTNAIDDLQITTGYNIKPVLCHKDKIKKRIEKYYTKNTSKSDGQESQGDSSKDKGNESEIGEKLAAGIVPQKKAGTRTVKSTQKSQESNKSSAPNAKKVVNKDQTSEQNLSKTVSEKDVTQDSGKHKQPKAKEDFASKTGSVAEKLEKTSQSKASQSKTKEDSSRVQKKEDKKEKLDNDSIEDEFDNLFSGFDTMKNESSDSEMFEDDDEFDVLKSFQSDLGEKSTDEDVFDDVSDVEELDEMYDKFSIGLGKPKDGEEEEEEEQEEEEEEDQEEDQEEDEEPESLTTQENEEISDYYDDEKEIKDLISVDDDKSSIDENMEIERAQRELENFELDLDSDLDLNNKGDEDETVNVLKEKGFTIESGEDLEEELEKGKNDFREEEKFEGLDDDVENSQQEIIQDVDTDTDTDTDTDVDTDKEIDFENDDNFFADVLSDDTGDEEESEKKDLFSYNSSSDSVDKDFETNYNEVGDTDNMNSMVDYDVDLDQKPLFKEKLGNYLVKNGVITDAQLNEALKKQKETGQLLGKVLVKNGYIKRKTLYVFLEKQLGVKYVDLETVEIQPSLLNLVNETLARRHSLVPFSQEGNTLKVAMSDPLNIFSIDDLRIGTGLDIQPHLADDEQIRDFIDIYYEKAKGTREVFDKRKELDSLDEEFKKVNEEIADETAAEGAENLEDMATDSDVVDAPIVKLVNIIFQGAVARKASDIHIEPHEDKVLIRYRVDGNLIEIMDQDKKNLNALVARIKIISGLNIAEKRIPQDGRITLNIQKKPYDMRVSILPTMFGEKVVARIADKEGFNVTKEQLGFFGDDLKKFENILSNPHGIVLVTGPTGSGKSTTLYTALRELSQPNVNIVTVEDPVESTVKGVNQVQVNVKAGLTFATALRSFLRQDPDIIMLGEIRDGETAEIAVRAAITGHLVLSTLHTNDAPSTVSRIIDMGIEPYLISSSVVGIIAQRLVRRLCKSCKREKVPDINERKILKLKDDEDIRVYEPVGCEECNDLGYKGRIAVHEVMTLSRELHDMITKNATSDELKDVAVKNGMKTLADNCTRLIKAGVTTIEEMLRIAHSDI